MKIGAKGLKALKIFHILMAIVWIGGSLAMMAVMLLTDVNDQSSMLMRAQVLKVIDDYLIIVGAVGCVLTGILYGLFTNWGFFRHRWITIKWLLTVLMVAMGIFAMGPCVNENVTATNLAVYQHNVETTLMWGWIPTVLQIVIIILSVWKPKLNMDSSISAKI
jgi:uncharacterized membrane protein